MILVTGGGGFIGSHVVSALLDAGHDVRVLDRAPAWVDERASLIVGDVRDPAVVTEAVRGVDTVFHQAAKVGLGVDVGDIVDYVSDNDLGTAVLLRAFRGRRLILASSMVVYGEGRYRCAAHGVVRPGPRRVEDLDAGRFEPRCACGAVVVAEPVEEDAPVDPRNVYAATKLAQEHLCAAFARETGVAFTALRYHNVYGPRLPVDTPYAGVAAIFRSAVLAGRAPRVFEDGAQTRDFVHVRDVARANVLALSGPPGIYNVCSGTPRTVLSLARAIGGEPVVTGEWRAGDVRHVFASPERAAAALGFRAAEDFHQSVSNSSS
ncbi:MAG TPA: NAD-dependent epimerase/dehydratase family protein [Solirubrobacter sp.]|nr:NAD-dependent epimerase/dehydratase family protein [Solirubrobacter sp.]